MNRFSITRRQAVFLFVICTISSKLQTLPCLLAKETQNNLWIVLLLGMIIDVVFLTLTIWINHICPKMTIYDLLCKTTGKFIAKIIMFVLIAYFLFTALMPYEAVRNVFANNLFDTLPWQSFSIFLIFAVGYLVFCGIKTIGRSAELYLVIIVSSVCVLFLLGLFTANYNNILPLFDVDLKQIANSYLDHSLWFGDYMIFFVLMGRIDTTKSALKFWDILIYVGLLIFYAFGYITFYSLYTVLAGSQTSLLTAISSFSLLNLSIGRVDWFLVLLTQIASVLSLATYLYCITNCLDNIIGQNHYAICSIITVGVLYFTDFLLFSQTGASVHSYMHITGIIATIIQTSMPIICIFCAFLHKKSSKIAQRSHL